MLGKRGKLNKLKKLILCFFCANFLIGCGSNNGGEIIEDKHQSISFNVENLTLDLFGNPTSTLKTFINNKEKSPEEFVWSVSKRGIVEVNNGVITAKSVGSSYVYASYKNESSLVASCYVNVTNNVPLITGIDLNVNSIVLDAYSDKTYQLSATVTGQGNIPQDIVWLSENEEIASVSETGLVTAISEGNTKIKCHPYKFDNFVDECVVTVFDSSPQITSMTFQCKNLVLQKGDNFNLKCTVKGFNNPNKEVIYSSSNESVATVDNAGKIIAKSEGNAIITASSVTYKNKSVSCPVKVINGNEIQKTELQYTLDDYVKENQWAISSFPNKGKGKLLVIPVWLTDSSNYILENKRDTVRDDISKAYFGSNSDVGWYSVKTYYEYESFSNLQIDGVVSDWYESPYSINDLNGGIPSSTVVENAIDWYFSKTKQSKLDFDLNNDGYLDGVVCIYGCPDNQCFNKKSDIFWAYTSWLLNSPNYTNPTANAYFWASYDFMYDSTNVYSKTGHNYFNGDNRGSLIDTHTFVHEMGHMFGLEDYYDYSSTFVPAGGFSMQDMNVGGHDPFSTTSLGWTKPYIPNESTNIRIRPFQESGDLIILSSHNNTINSPFDEYIIIELYSPTELNKLDSEYSYKFNYPQGPTNYGIRMWHVDSRLYSNLANKITTNPFDGNVEFAFSNTFFEHHCSPGIDDYYYYNLLQLIVNNKEAESSPGINLVNENMFYSNNSFDMGNFGSQFYYKGSMNSGDDLGWTIHITDCGSSGASVYVEKQST